MRGIRLSLRTIRLGAPLAAFGLVAALLAGCSSTKFSQTHYVGVVNPKSGRIQFYRFQLEGRPGLTNTKFATGWYDEKTLAAVFGDDVDLNAGESSGAKDRGRINYIVTGPEGEVENADELRFAIWMVSDPEPITKAITEISSAVDLERLTERRAAREAADKAKQQKLQRAACDALAKDVPGLCDLLIPKQPKNEETSQEDNTP